MEKHQNKLRLATIVLLCVVQMGFGMYAQQMSMMMCGTLGMMYVALAISKEIHQTSARQAGIPVTC